MTKSLHTPITMDDPLPGGEPDDMIEIYLGWAEEKLPVEEVVDPEARAGYVEFLKTWTGDDE